jgi:hypothetical protein
MARSLAGIATAGWLALLGAPGVAGAQTSDNVLVVHAKAPGEALPLAERAARFSDLPANVGTLVWIHHRLGADRLAAPLLERAVAGLPRSAPTLIHAAIVHAALGDLVRARQELDAALALDATVADWPDVQALRKILKPHSR